MEFELRILAWYEGVIGFLERREDHNHIIEGDQILLDRGGLSWGMQMAIVYRMERSKILRNQRMIVRMCRALLKSVKPQMDPDNFRKLVLRPTPDEVALEEAEPSQL